MAKIIIDIFPRAITLNSEFSEVFIEEVPGISNPEATTLSSLTVSLVRSSDLALIVSCFSASAIIE